MAARWLAAGNAAERAIHSGAIHGFTSLSGSRARMANARIDRFLAERVAEN